MRRLLATEKWQQNWKLLCLSEKLNLIDISWVFNAFMQTAGSQMWSWEMSPLAKCWLPKPLLGPQVIWDPGHVPKGVPTLRPDLRPWHDRDRWPHWWDQDRPGEPLLQQTPSHLRLTEPVRDVSAFPAETLLASRGPEAVGSDCLLWGGQPRLSFNISNGLPVSRAGLRKMLVAQERGLGWGVNSQNLCCKGPGKVLQEPGAECMCSLNQLGLVGRVPWRRVMPEEWLL